VREVGQHIRQVALNRLGRLDDSSQPHVGAPPPIVSPPAATGLNAVDEDHALGGR
jgi:hypothetical protein